MRVDIKNASGFKIKKDSINIDNVVNGRSTASFTVIDENARLHFNQGLPVEISNFTDKVNVYDGYNPLFNTKARLDYVKGKSQVKLSETDKEIVSRKVSETLKNELIQDENGEWRIVENVGKVAFNGTENWFTFNDYLDKNTIDFSLRINVNISINRLHAKSNYFENIINYITYDIRDVDIEGFYISTNGYYIRLRILKAQLVGYSDLLTNTEKVNLFKQWLQVKANEGNPLTVWYELAVKNPKEKVIEESDVTNDGINYYIAYPTDYLVGGNSSIDGVMLTDDGTQLVYPMTNPNPIGKTLTYQLAEPRLAEVVGLESVGGTIENQALPTLRGLETVFDELRGSFVYRRLKQVNLKDYSYITKLPEEDEFYVFRYPNMLDKPTDNIFSNLPCTSSYLDLIVKVPKNVIDAIVDTSDILEYEWVKQSLTWVPTGNTIYAPTKPSDTATTRWVPTGNSDVLYEYVNSETGDIMWTKPPVIYPWMWTGETRTEYEYAEEILVVEDIETIWTRFQPEAGEGYRWIQTGNSRPFMLKTHAFEIYVNQNTVEVIFETNETTEIVYPLIFDLVAEEPLAIDSLETDMKILINYKLYFKGFIDTSDETYVTEYLKNGETVKVLTHYVKCKDNRYLVDKRQIRKSYINMTCGDIVRDMIAIKLHEEGIAEGIIQDGNLMEEVVFRSVKCDKAIEKLAEASDFIWYIDHNRKLHFHARETVKNEIDLTEADCTIIGVNLGNQDYRNKQYIEGGKALTNVMEETFKGDGESKNFTLAFPCGEKPVILVDDIEVDPNDIGIKGVDIEQHILDENENIVEYAKKWFWSKNSNVIYQNHDNNISPKISPDSVVTIKYKGLFDLIVSVPHILEIRKRAELEGNSGIIEHIDEEESSTSLEVAFNSANSKLAKYAVDGKVINIKTRRNDLEVGQMIHAYFPKYDIDEDVLISKVRVYTEANNIVWHEVELLIGPEIDDFFKLIDKKTSQSTTRIYENIQEEEALTQGYEIEETWLETDTPNIFRELYPSIDLFPNTLLYPAFDINERITYMDVFVNGQAIIRVKHILQTSVNNEIITVFYLMSNQANGTITNLKFYGGNLANENIGTGTLIATENFDFDKTYKEILQIIRKDIKGY